MEKRFAIAGGKHAVAGVHPPDGVDLIKGYIEAFKKVFFDLVVRHADDDIPAHYSGAIFRAK